MKSFTFFGSIDTFLAICLLICLSQSQILAQERKIPVSGYVFDSLLNTPLPGASIRVIDAKGKIITGTVSDTLGNFTVLELPVHAKILISLIGYKLVVLTDTMYNGSSTRIPVKMRSVVLQTAPIIITGERPLVEYYVDKQVINIDKIPGAAGSTLVDALAKSGLVIVDPVSKTISLPGGKGVRLEVNGKSMLSIEEMIKLLPAGSVDKVEIMDTPTAKEDADGEIGVINIQLRRSLGDYLNGNVSLSASTQDFMHGDLLVNFKKDKTGIFLFTGLTQNIFVTHINSLSENRNLAAPYKNTDMARSYDESFSKFCNFGVDYDFDKMNFASVSANYFSSGSKNSYKGKTLYQYINGGEEFSIDRNSESNNNLFEYLEFTGFHKMKFENPGTELTSDILFEKIDNRNPSEIENIYSNLTNPEQQHENNRMHTELFIVSSDFVYPVDQSRKYEAGYKLTYRDRMTDYITETYDYNQQVFRDTGSYSNKFNYLESVLAGYVTFTDKIGVFNYKLGVRAEQTNARGEVETTGQKLKHQYTDLFPTGNIAYKVNPMTQVVLSVSRRITRPQMAEINPFLKVYSKFSAAAGNPDLLPMYSTRYELALKPYITFFYTDGKGKAQSVSINEPDGRLVRTTMNLGSIKTYGCDLTLMFSPWSLSFIPYPEWWSMGNLMVSYRKSIEKGSAEYFGSKELWELIRDIWMVNSFVSLRPGYDFDLTIGCSVTPGYSNVREKNLSTSNLYMSLSHSFLDEKLNIALNANDLLNSSNIRAWRYGSSYSSYSKFNTENSRNIAINISWKFNDYRYREKRDIKDGRD